VLVLSFVVAIMFRMSPPLTAIILAAMPFVTRHQTTARRLSA